MADYRETTHEKIMIKYGNVRATRFRLIFFYVRYIANASNVSTTLAHRQCASAAAAAPVTKTALT